MIATRYSFGEAIVKLGHENKNIVVLEADLGKSTQSYLFKAEFPERYFQIGLAESNMIGIASGLALAGKIPFICSFSIFITGCYDKIRMSIAYQNANVKIIGTHAGIGIGSDGNSQQALEDISLMKNLKNMNIIQPMDHIEAIQAIEYASKVNEPFFIRLTRQELPIIHSKEYLFNFKSLDILKKGKDIVIFATGATVIEALQAADILEKKYSISVEVINIHTIKPIDSNGIIKRMYDKKFGLSVEDHIQSGGLGSSICEILSEIQSPPFYRLGIFDFGESGSQQELYKKYEIDFFSIVRFIKNKINVSHETL